MTRSVFSRNNLPTNNLRLFLPLFGRFFRLATEILSGLSVFYAGFARSGLRLSAGAPYRQFFPSAGSEAFLSVLKRSKAYQPTFWIAWSAVRNPHSHIFKKAAQGGGNPETLTVPALRNPSHVFLIPHEFRATLPVDPQSNRYRRREKARQTGRSAGN